ncbi:MAG: ATP-dependent DNA ligase [Acidobacteriia bacterium]|nr:ATP-dependent DNA ligase [Terriglobia bacterium]
MKRFAELIEGLTQAGSPREKSQLLAIYLSSVPAVDAAWTLSLLLGRRPRRLVTTRTLCDWALQYAGIPRWLFEESHDVVGDLAETVALLVYRPADRDSHMSLPLSRWMEDWLPSFERLDSESQRRKICLWWSEMDRKELYVLNKLLTATPRVPMLPQDVFRSVSQISGLPITTMSLRLEGNWQPSADFFTRLIAPENEEEVDAQPYPFQEASALDQPLESLGHCEDWLVEWAFPGIRAQLIRRGNSVYLWSQDSDRMRQFPDICRAALLLPAEIVLDGRVVPFQNSTPLPPTSLENWHKPARSARKSSSSPLMAFMPYDLLEESGKDIRHLPLRERREKISGLMRHSPEPFRTPAVLERRGWSELQEVFENSQHRNPGFLMLRRLSSRYAAGPNKDWLECHPDPLILKAVLVNVKTDPRERLGHPSEYTLAVWKGSVLVPIARVAPTGFLEYAAALDQWVIQHIIQRFGSTYAVEPCLVLEITFDGITCSRRHKSGFSLSTPRITRWLKDIPAQEADTLECVARIARVPSDETTSSRDIPSPPNLFDKE